MIFQKRPPPAYMSMKYFRGESTLSIQCNACILLAIRLGAQQQLSTHASILGTFFRRENPHTQTQKLHNRLDYFIVLGSSTTIHTSPPIFLPFFQFIFFSSEGDKNLSKNSVKNFVLDVLLKWFFGGTRRAQHSMRFFSLWFIGHFRNPSPLFFCCRP